MLFPVLKKERTASIIVTVGLSFFLQNLVQLIFGGTPLSIPNEMQFMTVDLAGFTLGLPRVIAFGVVV